MSRSLRFLAPVLAGFLGLHFAIAAMGAETITVKTLKVHESEVKQLVEKVLPATVCVRSARGGGSGSGVVVSKDGLILTAAHVTAAAGNDLRVVFPDGREVNAKSLGANRSRDAGMAQITDKGEYPFAEVGKSEPLEQNEWCVSLGHAGGFDRKRTPPVRLGRVLANAHWVVTDCTLIGGDSGGPLFDLKGKVIGIHSNIGSSLSQNNHVPIDAFHESWDRLKNGETWGGRGQDLNRPVLGINLEATQIDGGGVRVRSVLPKSPADQAGVKAGDVVKQIDGKPVNNRSELIELVGKKGIGDELTLDIVRGVVKKELKAKLISIRELMRLSPPEERPAPDQNSKDDPSKTDPSKTSGQQPGEKQPASEPSKTNPEKTSTPKANPAIKTENTSPKSATSKTEKPKDRGAKPEPKKEPAEQKTDPKKKLTLEDLLRRARQNGGRLQLSREETRELRANPDLMRKLAESPRPGGSERDVWAEQVFAAYQPITKESRNSTYRVLVGKKQVAFATAISADGLLLTKASEIDDNAFQLELSPKKLLKGKVERTFPEFDLALIKVESQDLKPAKWHVSDEPLGAFIASVGTESNPLAIGVVSVKPRDLKVARRGFLGVNLESAEGGIRLIRIMPKSPAETAGLKAGDLVVSLNGKNISNAEAFVKAIGALEPDDEIDLKVRRGDKEPESVKVELADRANLAEMSGSRQGQMNNMSTRMNDHRSGYALALQHDCPILPEHCGGPLVDLDGRIIGINIARAGRIKSYAIPASAVQTVVDSINTKPVDKKKDGAAKAKAAVK
ncbi:MAG: PDZ domain-containing protein [Planctomycetota bacterium]|nr:PDZ domain-containing protein [Planctomycetota bacterium]